MISPNFAIALIIVYFGILILVSYFTTRKSDNQTFFIGNRRSPWYLVAFGMIGTSISGVTFISVPGDVMDKSFYYMQVVFGYIIGYFVIVYVLLPVYYKMQLTSIYTYLGKRLGKVSYKTGASLFLVSRLLGSAFRLYLVDTVLQLVIFDKLGVPFFVTVFISLMLVYVYTFRGGVRTIVFTDTLQTFFMLAAVGATAVILLRKMDLSFTEGFQLIRNNGCSAIFDFSGWRSETYFFKHFISGIFITIVMTGLDQDMMQKNLSCRNLKDAQKNMISYSLSFIPVNLLFLSIGALLYAYALNHGIQIPESSDNLYPMLATQGYMPKVIGVLFILGIIAAAYSSADSALTALTTSFLIDLVGIENLPERVVKRKRMITHFMLTLVLGLVILVFREFQNSNVINAVLKVAGFTYGPLLGLFVFGFYSKRQTIERYVPFVAILSVLLVFLLNKYSDKIIPGYHMGFEVLIVNGLLTILGLWICSKRTIVES